MPPSAVTGRTSDGSIEVVVPPDGTAYDVTPRTSDGSRDVIGADRPELVAPDGAEHQRRLDPVSTNLTPLKSDR